MKTAVIWWSRSMPCRDPRGFITGAELRKTGIAANVGSSYLNYVYIHPLDTSRIIMYGGILVV